ncbi:hypothetical protein E3P84_03345 [Wallemia ichthyophaga]|nr:hypothetical protein E3P84_03345 [Wallemia ichthyophaga]TIB44024.1 hypothetical protein E3P83_00446 [Wallemia ichthyophaga]
MPKESLRSTYISNQPNGWTFSDIPTRFPNSSANVVHSNSSSHISEASTTVKQLIAASLLQFGATSLSMPFEVGKVLLQVQYNPRLKIGPYYSSDLNADQNDDDDDLDDLDDPSDPDDLNSHSNYFRFEEDAPKAPLKPKKHIPKDKDGYLAQRPSYLVPLQADGGVWRMMRAVSKSHEGLSGLWKGTLTSSIFDISFSTLQPLFLSALSTIFLPSNTLSFLPIHQLPSPLKPLGVHVLAHTLTAVTLSPLDLVRTRMIVQSTSSTSAGTCRRAYSGPIDALRKIANREGGWQVMWTHPNLLLPTIVESSFKSLLQLCAPLVVERLLGVSVDSRPATYAVCELLWSVATMTLTLPLETVRRRLQTQDRSLVRAQQPGQLTPCIDTRPSPAAGMVECVYRIVTEECSDSSGSRWSGFKSLFRGFGLGLSASSMVFVLVSSCRTNFHQRPDMEKRSRFGRRDKHSLTHTATTMPEQPMHANDRATVSAASTANTSATTNGKATATPHLLPPTNAFLELLLWWVDVVTHSSAATSEGGSTFKMYRLLRKQDTTDTLIQTQLLDQLLQDNLDTLLCHRYTASDTHFSRDVYGNNISNFSDNNNNNNSNNISNNNSTHTPHTPTPFSLFVSLCSRYFIRVSYCERNGMGERSHPFAKLFFALPDECLAIGKWHAFTQLQPQWGYSEGLYRVDVGVHAGMHQEHTRSHIVETLLCDANDHHTAILIDRLHAAMVLEDGWHVKHSEHSIHSNHTDLVVDVPRVREVAAEIRQEIRLIITVKRLLRKSLTLCDQVSTSSFTSKCKSKTDIAALSVALKTHRTHRMHKHTRTRSPADIFSLDTLTQLHNHLYPFTRVVVLLDSLGTAYEYMDVDEHCHHLVWLYLDVDVGEVSDHALTLPLQFPLRHRVSVSIGEIMAIGSLSHPCITLTRKHLEDLVRVLRAVGASPYEMPLEKGDVDVDLGGVFALLAKSVHLLSTSPDIHWGGLLYHAYNTLLMIYTHLLPFKENNGGSFSGFGDALAFEFESGFGYDDNYVPVSYLSIDNGKDNGSSSSRDMQVSIWCAAQTRFAALNAHDPFEDGSADEGGEGDNDGYDGDNDNENSITIINSNKTENSAETYTIEADD